MRLCGLLSLLRELPCYRLLETELGREDRASVAVDIMEAARPVLTAALQEAMAPTIASMATIGLVSLPGMMTGVILGGADPSVAVMYQIAIMITIFTSATLTIVLAILLSRRIGFDDCGLLNPAVFA